MAKKKTTTKKTNKAGRPTAYKPEYVEQAKKLCLLGADDKALADFFGVSEKTINTWKNKYPEFFQSLKEGKTQKDSAVEKSLLERALGYTCPDTHISNYQGEITVTPIEKHYPPDTTACIFWLKNRKPDKWRDKQELEHSGDLKINIVNYGDGDGKK